MAPIESLSVVVRHRCLLGPPRDDAADVVVWLRGEHDLSTAPDLSEAMAWVLSVDDIDVVVDLSQVRFMSATTVGILIRARELLRARSRAFVVRSPSEWAQLVLQLCGAADLVDPEEALEATRTAGVHGTGVPVSVTGRVGHRGDTAASESDGASAPPVVGQPPGAGVPWQYVAGRAGELAADVTGVGAP